ncbi:MAG TPA: peptide ABC transporter substrate-binding protein [Gammaproteobacteria bacterium]|jgi:peptide/nickel transport system substrate-binding protein|nr:peptide ABC transporter substrate-binding protein [Gammaproteobacteria bacterium]|tara:strand:- start:1573 stop:3165 length:1593 start_codon:yes stop_codon:yes gene_type:complete
MKKLMLAVLSSVFLSLSTAVNADEFRTGKPTGEIDSITWYTFYRPAFGLVTFQFGDYPEAMIAANLCESLVRINPDFSLTPGVASWEQVDATTYNYTIRDGARFWDGQPVTAEDVVFSLGLHKIPERGSIYFMAHLNVDSITATGDKTVQVKLLQPDNTWTGQMAGPAGAIYQKAHTEAAGGDWGGPAGLVMCTGPYKPGKWAPGESLEIVRNDNYWNDEFGQLVRSVNFVWPQDPATVANAMNSGEIDGGWDVPPASMNALRSSKAGKLYVGPPGTAFQNLSLIVGNFEQGPLADVRVRQALSMAVDRKGMSKAAYSGGAVPLYSVVTEGLFSYAEDIFKGAANKIAVERDIEGAKALMKEVGDLDRPVVFAFPSGDTLGTELAAAVESAANRADIPFKVVGLPNNQYGALFYDPAAREGIDVWFTIYFSIARDPLEVLDLVMGPGSVFNYGGYSNDEVADLLTRAKAETDPVARAKLVVEIQDIFVRDLPWIPLLAPGVRVFENNRLTGAPKTFVYLNYPWAADLGAP